MTEVTKKSLWYKLTGIPAADNPLDYLDIARETGKANIDIVKEQHNQSYACYDIMFESGNLKRRLAFCNGLPRKMRYIATQHALDFAYYLIGNGIEVTINKHQAEETEEDFEKQERLWRLILGLDE